MNNLYDALEICLQEIEKGADLETVLFRYPDLADELRPILEASVKASSIAVADPSAEVFRRNRARVLQQAAQLREAKARPSRRIWSVPLRRALVSLAVIAALFISSTSLVRAASTTLPGDNLYPVKRTWEDVLLLLTFNMQARQALEIEHENERLEELSELFAEGRSTEVDFRGMVTRQNGDLWLVSNIPVLISAQTDLRDGPIQPGDAIRVRGITQPDGTVLAERVDRLSEGTPLPDLDDDDRPEIEPEHPENENESDDDNSGPGSGDNSPDVEEFRSSETSSREGVIDSISGSILIVNGQPMNIANAEVRGTPRVGAQVKVEGYLDTNGIFIVTRIEFREDGSGGQGDLNSNDIENEDDNNDTGGSDDNGNDGDNSGESDNGDDNSIGEENDNSGDDD